jgi:hypothetical protein
MAEVMIAEHVGSQSADGAGVAVPVAQAVNVAPDGQPQNIALSVADGDDEPLRPGVAEGSDEQPRPSKLRLKHPRLTALIAGAICVAVVAAVLVLRQRPPSASAPPVDLIRTTVLGLASLGGGLGIAYASDNSERAKKVENELGALGDSNDPKNTGAFKKYDDIAAREIDGGGAFMLRGMQISVNVEGLSDSEVTIYDIDVTPTHKPVPVGTAIILHNSGGGDHPRIMQFNMDSVKPVPRELVSGSKAGDPFFGSERIGLPKGHVETLDMNFEVTDTAAEFEISILYEVGGKKYIHKVDGGRRFRIAPMACPLKIVGSLLGITRPVDPKISALRYGRTLTYGYRVGKSNEIDPGAFRQRLCAF